MQLDNTYNELSMHLRAAGFHKHQYSIWVCPQTSATFTYWTMLSMIGIQLLGKFKSTVKGVKMYYMADGEFDATRHIQLGGIFSPELQGPTPAGLVPPHIPAIIPPALEALPTFTRDSDAAGDLYNWRI